MAYCVEAEKTAENGILFYKDVPAEGTSVVTKYEYVRPMGLKRILLCDGLIAGAAGLLIAAIGGIRIILFKKTKKDTIWVTEYLQQLSRFASWPLCAVTHNGKRH